MVCEPENMAGTATIIYLKAQSGLQGWAPPYASEESAENLSDTMSGSRGGGRGRKRPSVERPLTDTWR
jgi:hypothetical protein